MFPAVTELIPHRPPFLFVDEIVSESADGLIACRTWRADEYFYQGHYPGAPITPGEGVPLMAKISDVRFRSPIYPGDATLIEVKKKDVAAGFTMMSGSIKKTDGTRVLSVDFTVAWKTPEKPMQS